VADETKNKTKRAAVLLAGVALVLGGIFLVLGGSAIIFDTYTLSSDETTIKELGEPGERVLVSGTVRPTDDGALRTRFFEELAVAYKWLVTVPEYNRRGPNFEIIDRGSGITDFYIENGSDRVYIDTSSVIYKQGGYTDIEGGGRQDVE